MSNRTGWPRRLANWEKLFMSRTDQPCQTALKKHPAGGFVNRDCAFFSINSNTRQPRRTQQNSLVIKQQKQLPVGEAAGKVTIELFHQFDLARTPFLGEERFERAVEAQNGEPTPAGHCLYPVATLHAIGLGRTKMDCRRAIGIRLRGG